MIKNSLTVINEAPPVVTKEPIVYMYIINNCTQSRIGSTDATRIAERERNRERGILTLMKCTW